MVTVEVGFKNGARENVPREEGSTTPVVVEMPPETYEAVLAKRHSGFGQESE